MCFHISISGREVIIPGVSNLLSSHTTWESESPHYSKLDLVSASGWQDGAAAKVLALQALGPEFNTKNPGRSAKHTLITAMLGETDRSLALAV